MIKDMCKYCWIESCKKAADWSTDVKCMQEYRREMLEYYLCKDCKI
jgi:hypothetical protein